LFVYQELILKKDYGRHLKPTVYGFLGYVGNSWLMEMDMPRAAMEPDPLAVNMIKQNTQYRQVYTILIATLISITVNIF
jgi:hypothetical protein